MASYRVSHALALYDVEAGVTLRGNSVGRRLQEVGTHDGPDANGCCVICFLELMISKGFDQYMYSQLVDLLPVQSKTESLE